MKTYYQFIIEARRAKKARSNSKSYKRVKRELDDKEFKAGRLTVAQKHEIEKKEREGAAEKHEEEKKKRKDSGERGDDFSRHRMTGSRGHGSEYEANPRISYRHNEEVEIELEEE